MKVGVYSVLGVYSVHLYDFSAVNPKQQPFVFSLPGMAMESWR